MRCEHNDCGWCYAPTEITTNSQSGACVKPSDCPVLSDLEETILQSIDSCRHPMVCFNGREETEEPKKFVELYVKVRKAIEGVF